MIFGIYRFLTVLGAPLVRAYLRIRLAKGREDKARFGERLGRASRKRPDGTLVWCHGASVGEAASLLQLIEKLHESFPDVSFLVTTGTVTSAQMMEKRLPPYALHQYVPVDLPSCVKDFLDHWAPSMVIWVESELWPNALAALRKRSVPAVLLNARMSEKSFRNWLLAKGFCAEVLSSFRLCLAQTETDRSRFSALGAEHVLCAGNLKYAANRLPFDDNELVRLRAQIANRPVWLMASSHPGEEELAINAHEVLSRRYPSVLTVIAPRHPVRGDEVAAMIARRGQALARRSRGESVNEKTGIYLADTLGEMGLLFALCPVTVLGGSFGGTGGHNPIEPAHFGSALVFGPSMFNFSEIEKEFISCGAATPLSSGAEIAPTITRLWDDESARKQQAAAAQKLAEEKRSVMDVIVGTLRPLLATASFKKNRITPRTSAYQTTAKKSLRPTPIKRT